MQLAGREFEGIPQETCDGSRRNAVELQVDRKMGESGLRIPRRVRG